MGGIPDHYRTIQVVVEEEESDLERAGRTLGDGREEGEEEAKERMNALQ